MSCFHRVILVRLGSFLVCADKLTLLLHVFLSLPSPEAVNKPVLAYQLFQYQEIRQQPWTGVVKQGLVYKPQHWRAILSWMVLN